MMGKNDFSRYPARLRPKLEELRELGIDVSSLRADELVAVLQRAEEEQRRKEMLEIWRNLKKRIEEDSN